MMCPCTPRQRQGRAHSPIKPTACVRVYKERGLEAVCTHLLQLIHGQLVHAHQQAVMDFVSVARDGDAIEQGQLPHRWVHRWTTHKRVVGVSQGTGSPRMAHVRVPEGCNSWWRALHRAGSNARGDVWLAAWDIPLGE